MVVSEAVLKWAMRLYPPFFFQGVWTQKFEEGFIGARVKIRKCIFTRNYNNSTFGGTIVSAADPFYVILFHQILKRRGYSVRLWLKHASIDYIKPADCNLYFNVVLTEDEINDAIQHLNSTGKFIKTFPVRITNKEGVLYAKVQNEIYIKKITS